MGEKARPRSDALVFFGATGDLAYKKIFPALHSLVARGRLDGPVIGVAKADYTRERLIERARASIQEHGRFDPGVFEKLTSLLSYVDGDYREDRTFREIEKILGPDRRPLHYLAIPPSLFPTVIEKLGTICCTSNARVVVEKPFGRDLQSAQLLNRTLQTVFPEES